MTSKGVPVPGKEEPTSYWIKRWNDGQTAWHEMNINKLLNDNVQQLIAGRQHIRVLIPLCGKALELKWFADQGHTVVGIECSTLGAETFFSEHSLKYSKEPLSETDSSVYKAVDLPITIYCCDIFSFKPEWEKPFDAIWDCGSLVALEISEREKEEYLFGCDAVEMTTSILLNGYSKLMKSLLGAEYRYFIESYEYDVSTYSGHPHCLTEANVLELFGDVSQCQKIDSTKDEERHQIIAPKSEYFIIGLWLLTPK